MPRTRPYNRPGDTDTDDQGGDARPELALVAAMLRLVIVDAGSPAHHADIDTWVRSGAVRWWSDVLGLGPGFEQRLLATIRQRQQQGRRPTDRGNTAHPARGF